VAVLVVQVLVVQALVVQVSAVVTVAVSLLEVLAVVMEDAEEVLVAVVDATVAERNKTFTKFFGNQKCYMIQFIRNILCFCSIILSHFIEVII